MDNLRGRFPGHGSDDNGGDDYDAGDGESVRELPPAAIGQDERRMQVRAYNFWASALRDRNFPSIAELSPEEQTDFGPHSVLLDFSEGVANPAVVYLGDELAAECGAHGAIHSLADVPGRSLLSRITDHYMQILANQAPIGFEAEFVNQRGATILYRGILLPYSSDDVKIDFIYGVINWKQLADQHTTDELLLQIDQALEPKKASGREIGPLTEWADGPSDLHDFGEAVPPPSSIEFPAPAFGYSGFASEISAGMAGEEDAGLGHEGPDTPDDGSEFAALGDWLASARQYASRVHGCEERSRRALYAAVGCAYDFSLAAATAPEEFAVLVADAGLMVQERAPLTPLVKLVFGSDYDKTRLTEFAAVLAHAHRMGLERGSLARYLAQASGGLKGVVAQERRLRREESGPAAATLRTAPREALARKLRRLEARPLSDLSGYGSEFTLLVARRLPGGEVVLLGEVAEDASLTERAARHLLRRD